MAKRKHPGKYGPRQPSPHMPVGERQRESNAVRPNATELSVRMRPDGLFEFVHPRCATQREDDVREAQAMVAAGEMEVARDELRWLLQGCSDNLSIHVLLGEIAVAEADFALARTFWIRLSDRSEGASRGACQRTIACRTAHQSIVFHGRKRAHRIARPAWEARVSRGSSADSASLRSSRSDGAARS